MSSIRAYSRHLMNRVRLGLVTQPPIHELPPTDPEQGWEEQACGQSLMFAGPSSILSEVVFRHDREPVGWLPPRLPSPPPPVDQDLLSESIPEGTDLLELDNSTFQYACPDRVDPSNPESNSPSLTSSPPTGPSPASSSLTSFSLASSPPVSSSPATSSSTSPASTRSPSPVIQTLREKDRKKIRQSSGVKPKVRAPRKRDLRGVDTAAGSGRTLEVIQCQWDGCATQMHVDYLNVQHWAKHVREHYAHEPEVLHCKWEGGCGAVICKSSMWKHIVVHEPRFKIRCPLGCGVLTRADMVARHFQTCALVRRKNDESKLEGDIGTVSTGLPFRFFLPF